MECTQDFGHQSQDFWDQSQDETQDLDIKPKFFLAV
jgi:hypothetical protein